MTSRLPPWFKVRLPSDSGHLKNVARILRGQGLTTVCSSAKCPNRSECWSAGTATVMILGDQCTRGCLFCAVDTCRTPPAPEKDEPDRVAEMVVRLDLRYLVVTSVTRDDLPDEGVGQFGATVRAIRRASPQTGVELLVPDFSGRSELLDVVVDAGAEVVGHNLETVARLTPLVRDPKADFDRSLTVLRYLSGKGVATKTSLLLGLGETQEEVVEAFSLAFEAGARHLALGQYLSPSPAHAAVARWWTPEEFTALGAQAESLGYHSAASGPLVRSSYQAHRFSGSKR